MAALKFRPWFSTAGYGFPFLICPRGRLPNIGSLIQWMAILSKLALNIARLARNLCSYQCIMLWRLLDIVNIFLMCLYRNSSTVSLQRLNQNQKLDLKVICISANCVPLVDEVLYSTTSRRAPQRTIFSTMIYVVCCAWTSIVPSSLRVLLSKTTTSSSISFVISYEQGR